MVEGEQGSRPVAETDGAAARRRGPSVPGTEPGGLPSLLATLATLLEGHAPEDLVLLPRTELERREFRAYGSGWRDAAAEHRTLAPRPPARTPGQAAIIPFRRREAPAESPPQEADPPGVRSAPAASHRPALAPKSRRSKVPTIPRQPGLRPRGTGEEGEG
ncbi:MULTISPECIES: hypothetical protein [unclassified Streptomyces]|uniref:hypothetical protein n=1 Tax=unclassified Streptomyces TaxID=2593676 RepID=UPI00081E6B8F|nr:MULTISPECIES: hypothetical protein [unclassified Streptomyces]MYR30580.1 hypothetical protein [Streptomyces sp. SID4945]SCF50171.1 hypothetical protein GA0115257_12461 [Streptomyces sp. LcepLS]